MAADGESEKEEAALGKGHAVKESPHKIDFFLCRQCMYLKNHLGRYHPGFCNNFFHTCGCSKGILTFIGLLEHSKKIIRQKWLNYLYKAILL